MTAWEAAAALSLSGAATALVLEPGEAAVLGSIARAVSTSSADTYRGRAAGSAAEERVLLISVEVESGRAAGSSRAQQ